jgi:KipI family sensor histidine kinase inhibitor
VSKTVFDEDEPRFLPAGETALVVEFGRTIHPAIHDKVLELDRALSRKPIEGVIESVPTYRSLMIHFDPRRLTTEALIQTLRHLPPAPDLAARKPKRWRIPVCYQRPYAEDLAEVSEILFLPEERIVALHSGVAYRVYMYGFSPGFTFLGGLPGELGLSRRASPRSPAPPGSLLVAAGQALITSFAMPTGWYNLGRTPVRVFDPRRNPVFLADIGDEVVFEPIDKRTFERLDEAAAEGALIAEIEPETVV